MAGDLAYMTGEVFISGSRESPIENLRFTLGRKDPAGALLGPLNASEFTMGDIATPQTNLVARSEAGRGFLISSFPLDRPQEFDRATLRGDLPIGWEVELYRNGVLLDFRVAQDDGRYEFLDVPILYGRNELRLTFYGPQGQVREEVREVFVGPELLKPGETHYRVAVNQQDRSLISVRDVNGDQDQGELRAVAQVEVGLVEDLTFGVGVTSLPIEDRRKTFLETSLRHSLGNFAVRTDAALADDGGAAVGVSFHGHVGPINLLAQHQHFFDFESERVEPAGLDDQPLSRSFLRADSVLLLGDSLRLPITLEAEYERFESGRNALALANRLSTAYRRFSISNNLAAFHEFGGGDEAETRVSGSTLANYFWHPLVFRGSFSYGLHPEFQLDNIGATIDWYSETDTVVRGFANHDFAGDNLTLGASVNHQFEHFAIGATAQANSEGEFQAGVTVNFSLGREPYSRDWMVTSQRLARRGAFASRVYIDENANGLFDEGDEPLPDAEFVINKQKMDQATNEEGTIMMGALPLYESVALTVDPSSIEDPYLIPSVPGVMVAARPGAIAEIEFPFQRSGEIDGMVFFERTDGDFRGVGDVEIQLLDTAGQVVMTTSTEFDGFFLFERVPMGRYIVRPAVEQLERLAMLPVEGQAAELSVEESIVSAMEFALRRRSIAAMREEAEDALEDLQ